MDSSNLWILNDNVRDWVFIGKSAKEKLTTWNSLNWLNAVNNCFSNDFEHLDAHVVVKEWWENEFGFQFEHEIWCFMCDIADDAAYPIIRSPRKSEVCKKKLNSNELCKLGFHVPLFLAKPKAFNEKLSFIKEDEAQKKNRGSLGRRKTF